MPNLVDLAGHRYGRFTVLDRAANIGRSVSWRCKCDCGTLVNVAAGNLRNGASSSCGCLKLEQLVARSIKHGHTTSRKHSTTYASWAHMVDRCCNEKHPRFSDYGGRGITVCERWRESFAAFLEDMGEKPLEKHRRFTLERRDNEKDYEKANCYWADYKTQANNRRKRRWWRRPEKSGL